MSWRTERAELLARLAELETELSWWTSLQDLRCTRGPNTSWHPLTKRAILDNQVEAAGELAHQQRVSRLTSPEGQREAAVAHGHQLEESTMKKIRAAREADAQAAADRDETGRRVAAGPPVR